jgi:hypothetical protein
LYLKTVTESEKINDRGRRRGEPNGAMMMRRVFVFVFDAEPFVG